MKYEDLSDGIKANLAQGHVLARHTVTDEDWATTSHLTTVQLDVARDPQGGAVHYCNDFCGDMCVPGSVEIVDLEPEGTEELRLWTPMEVVMHTLTGLRTAMFDRYRDAIHGGREEVAEVCAEVLFAFSRGVVHAELPEEYEMFCVFLMDAVISDVGELPEFPGSGG